MAQITVDYAEEAGSPTAESWDDQGVFAATRMFRCAWSDRFTLAEQLRGYTGGVYVGVATYPGVDEARVRGIGIAPGGNKITTDFTDTAVSGYEHAVLTVQYATRAPGTGDETTDQSDGTVIEESTEVSAEYLNVPNRMLYWYPTLQGVANEVRLEEAPGLLIRMKSWTISVKNVQQNTPDLDQYIGCVNHAAVRSITLNETYPTGAVQFAGCSKSRQGNALTNLGLWTVTYHFLCRAYDWNKFFRSAEESPQFMYKGINTGFAGQQFTPYPYLDFVNTLRVKMA